MATKEKKKALKSPVRFDTGEELLAHHPMIAPPGKEKLLKDMEKYRQIALSMGAVDAYILPASEIPIELRVYYKCMFPRCYSEGTNVHCPPRWKTPWEHAKMIRNSFNYALIWRTTRKPENFLGPRHLVPEHSMAYTKYAKVEEILDARGFPRSSIPAKEEARKPTPAGVTSIGSASISGAVEKAARRDGHNFAMGFGAGGCIAARCAHHGFNTCVAIKSGLCRYAGAVRPEGSAALYTNFLALAAKMGWQHWIGAHSVFPEDVPDTPAHAIGMVMID